jgi:hypothetical protein
MWSGNRVLVSLAVLVAIGMACGPPLRSELFAVDFAAMRRPVMVSRPAQPIGRTVRRISAAIGTKGSLVLKGNIWTETTERSLVSASEAFKAGLQSDDRWFQIEGAEFRALDFNAVGVGVNERTITITGTAHR